MTVGVARLVPFVFAVTAACSDPMGLGSVTPLVLDPAVSGGTDTPAVPSEPPTVEELRARFPSAALRPAPCGEGFLGDGADPPDDIIVQSELPAARVLYVDVNTPVSPQLGDGSEERPFRSITEALAQASSGTWISVAPGLYSENLTIPGGVRLSGRRVPGAQPADAAPVVTAEAVTFSASAGPHEISVLENFEVRGTLNLSPGARVVLQHNVLSPTLVAVVDASSSGGATHRGIAVSATQAALRATNNRLVMRVDDPLNVISNGFYLSSSCAVLTDNYLVDYRTPFALAARSDVVVAFNVVDRGNNGVMVHESHAIIAGNYARLASFAGCVYAVTMTASRPEISENLFYLMTVGSRGLNEIDVHSDPLKVVGNAFRLGATGTVIYLDRFAEGSEGVHFVKHIQEVNAFRDIPEVSGNSLRTDSR